MWILSGFLEDYGASSAGIVAAVDVSLVYYNFDRMDFYANAASPLAYLLF